MLKLDNICWTLQNGENIVQEVGFHIKQGSLTVVTGPNGGGKTSIAKLTAGLVHPSGGRIFLDGKDITDLDITERAIDGIAYAFQQPVHFKGLKVRDLMEIGAGESLDEGQLCSILGKVGLCAGEYIDRAVDSSLSGGEIKRIEIAGVLMRKNAKLLVFDEPEAGIDLWSFSNLVQVFEDLKKDRDKAILVISHQERILEIADDIVVIADGRVRVKGSREIILPGLLNEERQSRCPVKNNRMEGLQYE